MAELMPTPDAALSHRLGARPALGARAQELFEELSPYRGDGLRNHCLRVFHFTMLLLERRRQKADPDLLHALAMIHDLGLLCPDERGGDYMQRSRSLFHRAFAAKSFELSPHDLRVADECLLYNHRLRPTPALCPESTAFRQSVWMDHSLGVRRYDLDVASVRDGFARYPRGDFNAVLLDFARRVLTREPWTLVDGIFM
ncbi:hypothetical protein WMF11_05400 [Sorangium sp. So ce295]|uniref:hypothetical protein n=1 Tax=Sorangium sp. So ce295 TaxID=3133295 RepID=UPI003F5DA016